MFNNLSTTWSWSLSVILFLLLLTLLYLACLWRAYQRHTRERDVHKQPVSVYRVIAFFAAIVIVAALLLTPISTIARTQLFSLHMAQAVILTTICAPLVLAGCSAEIVRSLLELPVVRGIVRLLTRPLIASILFNVSFLLWHAPRFFNAAQANSTLYEIMMLTIFFTSLLNWWPLIGSSQELRRMSYPLQMVYAFFDGQPVDIFAFILVFTGVPIYTHYVIPSGLNLTAFADQTVAGALLLIPGLVDLGVMSPLFFRWLRQIEQKTRLADQRRQERIAEEQEEEYEYYEEEEEEEHSEA